MAALISGFGSVKRMRVFDSPWMGHQSIAGQLLADAGTHLPTLEGRKAELAQAGKEVAEISSNLGSAVDRTGDLVIERQLRQPRPP